MTVHCGFEAVLCVCVCTHVAWSYVCGVGCLVATRVFESRGIFLVTGLLLLGLELRFSATAVCDPVLQERHVPSPAQRHVPCSVPPCAAPCCSVLCCIPQLSGEVPYTSAAFHPDGLLMVAGMVNAKAQVWEMRSAKAVTGFEAREQAGSLGAHTGAGALVRCWTFAACGCCVCS